MKIGLIGLGIMGKPMAKNILKAGYDLTVSDLNRANVEEVVACGAKTAGNREIGEGCDVVLTMLPNSPHVKSVMLGEDGVAASMKPGATFIDMSSINPVASKEIYAVLQEKGIEMLDAPVSGGEPKAIDGTLAFMIGGTQAAFDAARPLLAYMGTSLTLVGEGGAGCVTKLANQIIVNLTIAAVSEALVLATKAGADPEKVYQAIRSGLAGSAVLDAKAPMMLARNFQPGGKLSINMKDIKNVLATAHQADVPLPLSAGLYEIMTSLKNMGCLDNDHSGIVKFYERLAGVEVRPQ